MVAACAGSSIIIEQETAIIALLRLSSETSFDSPTDFPAFNYGEERYMDLDMESITELPPCLQEVSRISVAQLSYWAERTYNLITLDGALS
jgi:hypothetical protein